MIVGKNERRGKGKTLEEMMLTSSYHRVRWLNSLGQLDSWEEGTSTEKIASIRLASKQVCGRAWPHTVSDATPGQGVLSCIRKQAESMQASKQHSFIVLLQFLPLGPCFISCPDFLQWWTLARNCKWNKHFSLRHFWSWRLSQLWKPN